MNHLYQDITHFAGIRDKLLLQFYTNDFNKLVRRHIFAEKHYQNGHEVKWKILLILSLLRKLNRNENSSPKENTRPTGFYPTLKEEKTLPILCKSFRRQGGVNACPSHVMNLA